MAIPLSFRFWCKLESVPTFVLEDAGRTRTQWGGWSNGSKSFTFTPQGEAVHMETGANLVMKDLITNVMTLNETGCFKENTSKKSCHFYSTFVPKPACATLEGL